MVLTWNALGGAVVAAFLAGVTVDAADSCSNTMTVSYPAPSAAAGWSYRLIAKGFTRPRSIVFDSNDALLVVDSGKGVKRLTFKDDGGDCLSVDKQTTIVKNEDLNHGMALTEDGKTLYASSPAEVYSWAYNAEAGTVSDSSQTLIKNMSGTDHTTRTLLLSSKYPEYLLVSRGSQSNVDPESMYLDNGHSQIRAFNLTQLDDDKSSFDFLEGKVLGWGLRNSVGVAEHPETGGIWAVENSVDKLSRDNVDIHEDNPAEELNYLGFLNGSTAENEGANHGYPYCFTMWSAKDFPQLGSLRTGDQFPAENSKDLTNTECNTKYIPPRLSFQAHMAPLDIKFTDNGTEAFVTFHGSWDRTNPVGYHISSLDFANGSPTASQDSTTAAKDVLITPDLSKCPDDCVRPVGLAWDSKGRLWFSSDATGEIFVMYRNTTQSSSDDSGGSDSGNTSDSGSEDDQGSAAFQVVPSSYGWCASLLAVGLGFILS